MSNVNSINIPARQIIAKRWELVEHSLSLTKWSNKVHLEVSSTPDKPPTQLNFALEPFNYQNLLSTLLDHAETAPQGSITIKLLGNFDEINS